MIVVGKFPCPCGCDDPMELTLVEERDLWISGDIPGPDVYWPDTVRLPKNTAVLALNHPASPAD